MLRSICSGFYHTVRFSNKSLIVRYPIVAIGWCSFRSSHNATLPRTMASQVQVTQGSKRSVLSAKEAINATFHVLSRGPETQAMRPIYSTTPAAGGGTKNLWNTVLSLHWPETLSFEGAGRTKKEAEENAAKNALAHLIEMKLVSPNGKPLFKVSTNPTLLSWGNPTPTMVMPAHTLDKVPSFPAREELEEIHEKFPNFKTILFNCFVKVSHHLKDANYMVKPAFHRIKAGTHSLWQCRYNLRWPESKLFSGVGNRRSEAEKWAILSALHWLKANGFLHDKGYPIMYSVEELSQWRDASKNPAVVKLSPQLLGELETLILDFNALKPVLDDDRAQLERGVSSKHLIWDREHLDEDGEGDFDGQHQNPALVNDSDPSNERLIHDPPVDGLTGRPRVPLSSVARSRRNEQLLRSAERRALNRVDSAIAKLPIFERRQEILNLIEQNRVIILSGDTGCGKSTQVPQFLLDSWALKGNGADCNIIVTQPRRLAALSLAQTVACHRGERVGESVGYQIRLKSALPEQQGGAVLFCSTGILLRRIQACPDLNGVSHLIIDEVHERDCLTDFTLVIIKDLLATNPSLKVILMSASLNAHLLSSYFDSAPLIHVSGRTFPVQQYFLSDVEDALGYRVKNVDSRPLVDQELVVKLIRHIDLNRPPDGAILCFLPGWSDIKSLHSRLKEHYPSEETHWILPVHSRLSHSEQERIFDRPPSGVRKVVLATNIAETSLTINDVVYVIDPGVHKELRFNPHHESTVMDNQWISRANVQQRAGRAGRVRPGESYHLYSRDKFEAFEPFSQAEMLRIPLEQVVIDIKAYDEELKAADFLSRALEPPSNRSIEDAINDLVSIGVLDENERLTPLGRRIAQFSTHPRLAKSLVYATLFRCLDPVASIVAGLSSSREAWATDSTAENHRQIIRQAKRRFHNTSDHLALAKLISQFRQKSGRSEVDEFCSRVGANPKALYFLKGVRNLLVDHLCEANLLGDRHHADSMHHPVNENAGNEEMVKAALLLGLGDRILRVRHGRLKKGVIKTDEIVVLSEKHGNAQLINDSVNAGETIDSDFIIYFNGVYQRERRVFSVFDTSQVSTLTTMLAAGNQAEFQASDGAALVAIDGQTHLRFSCSAKEAELLVKFRSNLVESCNHILLTTGRRESSRLTSLLDQYHRRQINFLGRLLLSSQNEADGLTIFH